MSEGKRLFVPPINPFKHFKRNKKGRDLAVGDLHGCFTKLYQLLEAIGFDGTKDRLFIVGDLVDRGPESQLVRELLKMEGVYAIRGNHDGWVIQPGTGHHFEWVQHGGGWYQKLSDTAKKGVVKALSALPIAIEVETARGLVGMVHADIPFSNWQTFVKEITEPERMSRYSDIIDYVTWSRNRIRFSNESVVEGIAGLVVGHSTVDTVTQLGNVYFIDTGGWLPRGGSFTLLDLNTLEVYKHGKPILGTS